MWNIDLTLVDVGRVSRDAYAEAFRRVTGLPLVALPQFSGKGESEIFFEALALNDVDPGSSEAGADELLARYCWELAAAFHARYGALTEQGRLLPGADGAVAATARLPGVVQSVLTGSIKANALDKLRAFGLAEFFDLEVGGYGSDVYPRGTQLVMSCGRVSAKYGSQIGPEATVYLADSGRDVEAARISGARCVAVATGRASAGELREAGADLVLNDLSDPGAVVHAVNMLTGAVVAEPAS